MSKIEGVEKVGKPVPRCKTILLCERAITEPGTSKVDLIGVHDKLVVPRVPTQARPMTLFLQLVDWIGRYSITAEVIDLNTGHSLANGKGATFEFKDRLAVIQIILPLPPLPLQHEGSFDVVVFADGQEIDRRKFTVSCGQPQGDASA
jgi:hypothetical protein